MLKKEEVQVSEGILRSLRTSSGYSLEDVAEKTGTSPERVSEIEEGRSPVKLAIVEKLADIYHRPLAAFFTEELPEEPKVTDFRINRGKKLSPKVFLAERRAHYLSQKLADLSEKKSDIPMFSMDLEPEKLAEQFRNYLDRPQIKSKKSEEILGEYKKTLEDKLDVIIIEYPLKTDDVRAFSLFDQISSVVLNEHDDNSIKLFSLFHEICHLLRRTSAVCSIEIEQENKPEEEQICDKFAAEFLVPLNDLVQESGKYSEFDWKTVTNLAKVYGVSKQVLMLRLVPARRLQWEDYRKYKKLYYEKEQDKKKEFARRNWNKVYLNRVGNLAIKEVGNAYRNKKISTSEVIDVLDLKTKYMRKVIGK